MYSIDINSDVGEGIGNEAVLLPLLSSCNIACGGHAGDDRIIQKTIELAIQNNVKIGAHPGYPDRENFGRKILNIPRQELAQSLTEQITKVKDFAKRQKQKLHHVKVHGALYNLAAVNIEIANLVIEVVKKIDDRLILYVPYHSVIQKEARGKLLVCVEGFADRSYNDDYTLVNRTLDGAVIYDVEAVLSHVVPMIKKERLTTINNNILPFQIDTLCVHGDTMTALQILKELHKGLQIHQIEIH